LRRVHFYEQIPRLTLEVLAKYSPPPQRSFSVMGEKKRGESLTQRSRNYSQEPASTTKTRVHRQTSRQAGRKGGFSWLHSKVFHLLLLFFFFFFFVFFFFSYFVLAVAAVAAFLVVLFTARRFGELRRRRRRRRGGGGGGGSH
jgi:Flp pilus assembly protein TadB